MNRRLVIEGGCFLALLFGVFFQVSGLSGCSTRTEPQREVAKVVPTPPVDTELLAFLSLARAAHHEANLDEAENQTERAIATLERLVRAKRPSQPFPEMAEVLSDTYARLAELRLRSGALDAALSDVREGRSLVTKGSYFDGHLHEVEGMIEEARSSQLTDAGKNDGAAEARDRARAHLREAARIQEAVIERALSDAGK